MYGLYIDMDKYLLSLPEEHYRALQALKQQTDLSVAVLLRLMVRHCLQGPVLNEVVPCASGATPLAVCVRRD